MSLAGEPCAAGSQAPLERQLVPSISRTTTPIDLIDPNNDPAFQLCILPVTLCLICCMEEGVQKCQAAADMMELVLAHLRRKSSAAKLHLS